MLFGEKVSQEFAKQSASLIPNLVGESIQGVKQVIRIIWRNLWMSAPLLLGFLAAAMALHALGFTWGGKLNWAGAVTRTLKKFFRDFLGYVGIIKKKEPTFKVQEEATQPTISFKEKEKDKEFDSFFWDFDTK